VDLHDKRLATDDVGYVDDCASWLSERALATLSQVSSNTSRCSATCLRQRSISAVHSQATSESLIQTRQPRVMNKKATAANG
jgi:hypothetical protein